MYGNWTLDRQRIYRTNCLPNWGVDLESAVDLAFGNPQVTVS